MFIDGGNQYGFIFLISAVFYITYIQFCKRRKNNFIIIIKELIIYFVLRIYAKTTAIVL